MVSLFYEVIYLKSAFASNDIIKKQDTLISFYEINETF